MQNTTTTDTLTQTEKAFLLCFLTNTFAGLTQNNADSLLEALEPAEAEYFAESYFVRLQDAQEVLEHLNTLYATAEQEPARFTFTIEQAAAAIVSYDTEYRESIIEQLEYACTEDLQRLYAEFADIACKQTNFATLVERLCNNY
jgi:hypothetical protein